MDHGPLESLSPQSKKMLIEVKLYSSFRNLEPPASVKREGDKWQLLEDTTVHQVLKMLKIDREKGFITLINGYHTETEARLKEGDILHIFPAMFGG